MKKVHVNQKVGVSAHRAGPGQYSMDNAAGYNSDPNQQSKITQALGHIQLHNFIKAIEMVMNDSKLDPYILVSKLMTTYYAGVEKIDINNLKKFFVRFGTYFQD